MKKPIEKKQHTAGEDDLPLHKQNYILMIVGFAIIILGFILMSGNTDIYGFQKTVLATIVVMFGFLFEIYAIMHRPNAENTNE